MRVKAFDRVVMRWGDPSRGGRKRTGHRKVKAVEKVRG
jgi:hypothetical protein